MSLTRARIFCVLVVPVVLKIEGGVILLKDSGINRHCLWMDDKRRILRILKSIYNCGRLNCLRRHMLCDHTKIWLFGSMTWKGTVSFLENLTLTSFTKPPKTTEDIFVNLLAGAESLINFQKFHWNAHSSLGFHNMNLWYQT